MNFLEKDLETIIYETPNIFLQESGLYIYGEKKRQVNIGNYGTADLIALKRNHCTDESDDHYMNKLAIFELKKNRITIDAFLQAVRYLKGIRRYLSQYHYNLYERSIYEIVLIGREIDTDSDFVYLTDLICSNNNYSFDLSFYTYDFKFDGISFNRQSHYKLSKEGF